LHIIFTFRSCSKIFVSMRLSMTPHAPCMRYQWHRIHHACGVNDTACILKIRISSRIRIYIRQGFSPLIRGPGRMFWWNKNRGSKISWHCPFKFNQILSFLRFICFGTFRFPALLISSISLRRRRTLLWRAISNDLVSGDQHKRIGIRIEATNSIWNPVL
jgi:hypothetical protein